VSRISQTFTKLKESGKKGLIVYITAGYPDMTTTLAAVQAAEAAGADLIEIGIPFSDPMADGPVIQKASTLALQQGATTGKALDLITRIRERSDIPLAAMTYINPVLHYGIEKFLTNCAAAGLDGLIVPDLPMEEGDLLEAPCKSAGINLIQFVAPTTSKQRISTICQKATGFLYCISTTGVTGVRQLDYQQIGGTITGIRQHSNIPVAIGFGIGSAQAAREAAQHADAVIVGSAVMQALMDNGIAGMRTLIQSMRQGLDEERE
jgi:tryptophan synthase alpha chain